MIRLEVNHKHHHHHTNITLPSEKQHVIQQQKNNEICQKKIENRKIEYQQTISKVEKTKNEIKLSIEDLLRQYKESQILFKEKNPEKQKQIQLKLSQLQKQKKKRHQKIKLIQQRQFLTLQNKQKHQKQLQSERKSESKQKKRKKIQYKLRVIEMKAKEREQQAAQFQQFYIKYKKTKPKYQIYQQQFESKISKEKMQQEQKIKNKIKQRYSVMSKQDLDDFQQKYLEMQYQQQLRIIQNREFKQKQLQQKNQRLNKIWRGKNYSKVQQQYGSYSQGSTEKSKRTKEYSLFIKKSHQPKHFKPFFDMEVSQLQKSKKTIKYRYHKGVNEGFTIQDKKIPLSYNEVLSKGSQYLSYVKKLPKSQKQEQEKIQPNIIEIKKSKPRVPSVIRQSDNSIYFNRHNSISFENINDHERKEIQFNKIRRKDEKLQMKERLLNHINVENLPQLFNKNNQLTKQLVHNINQKMNILNRL